MKNFLQSNTARLIIVGMLTLILLIPLALVRDLIGERAVRQQEVKDKITARWGGPVNVYGPILKIPYITFEETVAHNQKTNEIVRQRKAVTQYAYFFPETLNNKTSVNTEKRHYGYFEAAVYTATLNFDGVFIRPDFAAHDVDPQNVLWDKATVMVKSSNLKSIQNAVVVNLNGTPHGLEPQFGEGMHDVLESRTFDASYLKNNQAPFSFSISYRGSDQLYMVPIGKTTTSSMSGNWTSPSFSGHFLPNTKGAGDGFPATWKILHVNRPFGQQAFGDLPDLSEFAFGVDFSIPVDQYLQNERASKYGFLIIGLTFLIFFLIQVMSKIRIHVFQYTMIGLALIMFYTLLLSITEHSSFALAYLVSSVAVVVMISAYSITILKNKKFPAFIGAALGVLYAFIYVIIRMEDYALLFGSIGLFAVLGTVMYVSRKIDWGN